MSTATQRAVDPNATLATALRIVTGAVLVLALAAIALPAGAGDVAAWLMVDVLIAAPLARVAWLAARWLRERDWIFVALAGGLLALTGCAAAIAALTR